MKVGQQFLYTIDGVTRALRYHSCHTTIVIGLDKDNNRIVVPRKWCQLPRTKK